MPSSDESVYAQVEHLRERVQDLARGFTERLNEISASEYPNATPALVVKTVSEIVANIVEITKTAGEPVLRAMSDLLMFYGELLNYLDNAKTEQTPTALTGMLEWVYAHLGETPPLLACPISEYNYSIFDLLKVLKNSTSNLLSKKNHDKIFGNISIINVISFPRIERDNVLLHSIFGHEIGHPFAEQYLLTEELGGKKDDFQEALRKVTKQVEEEFAEALKTSSGFPGQIDIKTAILSQILEIRRRGLQELLSDAVAVQIFGPSAIFASHEIFMSSDLDSEPAGDAWYPSNRYRIRLMVDLAKRLNQWAALESSAPDVATTLRYLEDLADQNVDHHTANAIPPVMIAYKWIEDVLPEATEFVLEATKAAAYTDDQVTSDVPRLVRRLAQGIPPNEIGAATTPIAVDWRSSILAAWVYRYRKLGSGELDFSTTMRSTRKAIEYVLLRERFDASRAS